ncbi:MAG: helix-turn-helix domain-containing protein [Thermoplasmata archaeon]
MEDVAEMFAASFEALHECPVGKASLRFPDLRILSWCASNRDIFQVTGSPEQREGFSQWVEEASQAGYRSHRDESTLIITQRCACAAASLPSIGEAVRAAGVWDIPPIAFRNGWESWRVLAWSEESLRDLFRRIREIGKVRITSLRPIDNAQMEQMMLVPASDIFAGVTDRQLSALILGLEHGYYSIPAETRVDRLAEGAGLSPSTFGEHLQKAEIRIFRNLRPYLQAYAGRLPGEGVLGEVRPAPSRLV